MSTLKKKVWVQRYLKVQIITRFFLCFLLFHGISERILWNIMLLNRWSLFFATSPVEMLCTIWVTLVSKCSLKVTYLSLNLRRDHSPLITWIPQCTVEHERQSPHKAKRLLKRKIIPKIRTKWKLDLSVFGQIFALFRNRNSKKFLAYLDIRLLSFYKNKT